MVKARAIIPGYGTGPWVFAAGTVDAPASIEDVNLADESATKAQAQSATSPTSHDSSGGAAFPRDVTLTTLSWTNALSRTVVVQYEAAGRQVQVGGNSACTVLVYHGLDGDAPAAIGGGLCTTTELAYTKIHQRTVPAGRTVTYQLIGRIAAFDTATTTHTMTDFESRLTAIKA